MAGTIAFDSGVVVNPNSQFPTRTVILEYVGWTVNPFASQVIQLIDTPNDLQDARQIISRSISWLSSSENAGGGKSTLCAYFIQKFKGTHVVACPQNTQAAEWKAQGFNAMTLYDLCGMKVGGEEAERVRKSKRFDLVVFEEFGQYQRPEAWSMVADYILRHKRAKIILNGDVYQTLPIERDLNPLFEEPQYRRDYYRGVCHSLCQGRIVLRDVKRYKQPDGSVCPVLTARAKELKQDLFEKRMPVAEVFKKYATRILKKDVTSDMLLLTYLQDTRRAVNEYVHKSHTERFYPGLVVRANTGMKISGKRIYKNFDYTIAALGDGKVTLLEELSGEEFELEMTKLANFSLPYAHTGHSVQGITTSKPVVVFDTAFRHVDAEWAYTALTRNKHFNVSYCTETPAFELDPVVLGSKVQRYQEQDISAKRNWEDGEYITPDWIKKQFRRQRFRCAQCQAPMNIVPVEGDMLNMTVDRKDNSLAHTRGNCCLLCFNCNVSKK